MPPGRSSVTRRVYPSGSLPAASCNLSLLLVSVQATQQQGQETRSSAEDCDSLAPLYFWISPSLNGSPHSGQNFGGCLGSSGSQPHLSHLYRGSASGFFAPHSGQNLPLLTAPQEHTQPFCAGAASGFFAPHSGQNLPVTTFPQAHCQLSAAGFGSGFLLPQFGQKFPVIPL